MGVDIHMYIVAKNGKMKFDNIFEGRNREWFDALQNQSCDVVYDSCPIHRGLPECVPSKITDAQNHDIYYGFHYMNVSEFKTWFAEKRPDIDAGWCNTYDKWLYETKKIQPEVLYRELSEDANPNDWHFIEVWNPYDCNCWLFNYLEDYASYITDSDNIVYYFDC